MNALLKTLIRIDLHPNVESIKRNAALIIQNMKKHRDRIIELSNLHPLKPEKLAVMLNQIDFENESLISSCEMPEKIHPDILVRNASTESSNQISEALKSRLRDPEMFSIIEQSLSLVQEDKSVEQVFLREMLKRMELNGSNLSSAQRESLSQLQKQIISLNSTYYRNIADYNEKLIGTFDLSGVSSSVVNKCGSVVSDTSSSSSSSTNSPVLVSISQPMRRDLAEPILDYCTNESTRKAVYINYSNRGGIANNSILQSCVNNRHDLARLMGYSNYSDYVLNLRMARTSQTVDSFVTSLIDKLSSGGKEEMEKMKDWVNGNGIGERIESIHRYNLNFYNEQMMKKIHQVDTDQLQEHYPVQHVLQVMIDTFSELFGLKITEVDFEDKWHESVKCYTVKDCGVVHDDDGDDDGVIHSVFFIDLFSREGKYPHSCVMPLQSSGVDENGTKQIPVCVMLSNMPSNNGMTCESDTNWMECSFLSHSNIVTLFHEFGHVLNCMVNHSSPYIGFGSFTNLMDFVEVPSQFIEQYAWNKELLMEMSDCSYRTGNPLREEVIDELIASRSLNQRMAYLRQLALSKFDFDIHHDPSLSTQPSIESVYSTIMKETSLLPTVEGTNGPCSFMHTMTEMYASSYYSYLWSLVYSFDLISYMELSGSLFNKDSAQQLKRILNNNFDDPNELMERVLGRKPSNERFLKYLGI